LLAWTLNLIYLALLLAVSPWIAFQMAVRGKYRTGLAQKLLGNVEPPPGSNALGGNSKRLWFHAVSVGEVLQIAPLLELLAEGCPETGIVISTTTVTGYDLARRRYPKHHVIYCPLDFSWAVHRALARIDPAALVLVELELWPNLILAAARRKVPVILVNARVSERSFRGYRRIAWLMRRVLSQFRVCLAQNETYAARLKALGADPSRVAVTGSIKYDRVETNRNNPRTRALQRAFGLGTRPGERVLVAGSTQDPEERYALEIYRTLRSRHPGLRLILVPRHQERFDEVARLVEKDFELPLLRRSRLPAGEETTQVSGQPPEGGHSDEPPVILLDTLGELSACWGLAEIAFVGGSLTQRGGQNMIEPAGYGAAVIFGPNTWNFKDAVELLKDHDGATIVADRQELAAAIARFLDDPAGAQAQGERAARAVALQRGASQRTVSWIRESIGIVGPGLIP
jgi:3-deoxy-D-manno-octulosonic-acid transferase